MTLDQPDNPAQIGSALPASPPRLPARIWIALLAIGFTGQLAWGVENQFFNTFLYNQITPDPRPISWMVAITAVVSTLTALTMGALSDRTRTRWGRRRPYIFVGYLLWGVFTAVFPASALASSIGLGVALAILLDSIMTFFGATANDAAFNAYIADVTTPQNRGRVSGALEIVRWVAFLIIYGGAAVFIEHIGYAGFFMLIGGLVLVSGLAFGPLLAEPPVTERPAVSYRQQLLSTLQPGFLKAHRDIFLVLLALALFNLAQQVFFPYLLIYLQHFIRLPALEYSILVAVAILAGGILMAYPLGWLVDRWGRKPVALLAVFCEALGLLLFSFSRSFLALTLSGILWLTPIAAFTITLMAWTKDLYPEDRRGQFAGYYILFGVLFAMIPGPLIGGWLGSQFGIPAVLDGKPGFIPTPLIFQVSALLTLLAALPLGFTRYKK